MEVALFVPELEGMAKSFEELECWQLADRLRKEVWEICKQEQVCRWFKFCDGFTDAAGSVCRNISEGFRRQGSPQIVQFFGYALGSIAEVKDYLIECLTREYITRERCDELLELLEHAQAKTLNFKRYHERRTKREKGPRTQRAFFYHVAPDRWTMR